MLTDTSSQLADVVDAAAPSVVQVRAGGRASSGIVYDAGLVLTTGRAIGRDEHPEVRDSDGRAFAADLAGWDPASRLVLLKVPELTAQALPGTLRGSRPTGDASGGNRPAGDTPRGSDLEYAEPAGDALPRVGSLAIAIGRSISNNVTATLGMVSIIGGPLRTGPRRQLDRVIRISAPVHSGFAGGAVVGAGGALIGIATAVSIRGLTVVIPAAIAREAAKTMVEGGSARRGYLGIAAQPVRVPERQRAGHAEGSALLVVAVKDGSPAADAGLLVGDILVALDDVSLTSPEELVDMLVGDRVGRALTLHLIRGGAPTKVTIIPTERR
jgi:S1-C subfamily serine protease